MIMVISASSCMALLDNGQGNLEGKTGKLIVSGIVTDRSTNSILEGICITMDCDTEGFQQISQYTNNEGMFTIIAAGFTESVTGCIRVSDPEGRYQSESREFKVNWNGESYDPKTATFFLNDCNFQLKRE